MPSEAKDHCTFATDKLRRLFDSLCMTNTLKVIDGDELLSGCGYPAWETNESSCSGRASTCAE
jgi:hypothetical protein